MPCQGDLRVALLVDCVDRAAGETEAGCFDGVFVEMIKYQVVDFWRKGFEGRALKVTSRPILPWAKVAPLSYDYLNKILCSLERIKYTFWDDRFIRH